MNQPFFARHKNSWETKGVIPEKEDDEIVREVRRARQRLLDESGGSLHELVERLKKRQDKRGLPLVRYPPRRPPDRKADGTAEPPAPPTPRTDPET